MLLLADTVAAHRALGRPQAARRLAARDVPAQLQPVWRRLAGDVDAWVGEVTLPSQPVASRPVIVIDHAPGSQFTLLQTALREAAVLPDDLACFALAGSGFRGQRGRTWEALRGNLHLSAVARLDRPAASVQAALTALPAVAAARAIEHATEGRLRPAIKWVNDLLLDERKVGGVLSATVVQGRQATHAVVGIGLNVARAPQLARDPRTPPAGSLADAAGAEAPALEALTRVLLTELDRAIAQVRSGDEDRLVEAYRRRSLVVGRRVAVWPASDDGLHDAPWASGRVTALRSDLGLELEGVPEPVHIGRLTLLDAGLDAENAVEHEVPEDG